ncbi:hypothetical protein HDU96_008987 [Phlyctochytrium bullatum]|nr:hypothetical protein HDU96_008987 [Phlyctochytrium bullatum]
MLSASLLVGLVVCLTQAQAQSLTLDATRPAAATVTPAPEPKCKDQYLACRKENPEVFKTSYACYDYIVDKCDYEYGIDGRGTGSGDTCDGPKPLGECCYEIVPGKPAPSLPAKCSMIPPHPPTPTTTTTPTIIFDYACADLHAACRKKYPQFQFGYLCYDYILDKCDFEFNDGQEGAFCTLEPRKPSDPCCYEIGPGLPGRPTDLPERCEFRGPFPPDTTSTLTTTSTASTTSSITSLTTSTTSFSSSTSRSTSSTASITTSTSTTASTSTTSTSTTSTSTTSTSTTTTTSTVAPGKTGGNIVISGAVEKVPGIAAAAAIAVAAALL